MNEFKNNLFQGFPDMSLLTGPKLMMFAAAVVIVALLFLNLKYPPRSKE